jgi:hypothetical protein
MSVDGIFLRVGGAGCVPPDMPSTRMAIGNERKPRNFAHIRAGEDARKRKRPGGQTGSLSEVLGQVGG